jgi:hypothetical protein
MNHFQGVTKMVAQLTSNPRQLNLFGDVNKMVKTTEARMS